MTKTKKNQKKSNKEGYKGSECLNALRLIQDFYEIVKGFLKDVLLSN